MAMFDYSGKRVVVTGASSGIGEATARALADLGAEVIGVGLAETGVELTRYECIDLCDPSSIAAGVNRIGGRIDTLFNCAGAVPMAPPLDVVKVNFLGTRMLTQLVVQRMSAGAAVVNVSSDAGYAWRRQHELLVAFLGIDDFDEGAAWFDANREAAGHAYGFSKAALNVWTMMQAQTLIHRGIRINTVSPGAVQTPMLDAIEAVFPADLIAATEQPIGRRSAPEEQAWPIIFLGSDAASYVNGADLPVDGGYWAALSLTGELWRP